MQTAAQVPNIPVPVPPPPIIPKRQSNKLVTTSFVMGLIVFLPILFIILMNITGNRIQLLTGIHVPTWRALVIFIFGFLGLIGLFIGSIGFVKMISTPQDKRPYFKAISGIVLCFAAFFYLLMSMMISFGNIFASLVFG